MAGHQVPVKNAHARCLQGQAQAFLGLLAGIDVDHQRHEVIGLPGLTRRPADGQIGPALVAILAPVAFFEQQGLPAPDQSVEEGRRQAPVIGMGDVAQGLAQQGLAGVADDLAVAIIGPDQTT